MRCALLLAFVFTTTLTGQTNTGELRIAVTDQSHLPIPATVEIISTSNDYHRTFEAAADGKVVARRLAFGIYRVELRREGFARSSELVEVRSSLPIEKTFTLGVQGIETTVVVTDADTLID